MIAGLMMFLGLALLGNPAASAAQPKDTGYHSVAAKQKAKPAKKIAAGKKSRRDTSTATKAKLKVRAGKTLAAKSTTKAKLKVRAGKTLAAKSTTKAKLKVGAGKTLAAKKARRPGVPKGPLPPTSGPKLKVDNVGFGPTGSGALFLDTRSPALPWAAVSAALALAGGVFLWRRRRQVPAPWQQMKFIDPSFNSDMGGLATANAAVKADLLQRAEPFFVNLRMASRHKDHDFILQHCTEDLATSLILDSETKAMAPQVEGLKAELVDLFEEANRYVASVQYTAHVQQGDTPPRKVQELWHFVHGPNTEAWRLAAVEPA